MGAEKTLQSVGAWSGRGGWGGIGGGKGGNTERMSYRECAERGGTGKS